MLLEQKIPIVWRVKIRNYYVNKGYKFTKFRDVFYVDAADLKPNSSYMVKYTCDFCKNEHDIRFSTYETKRKKFNNTDVCHNCKSAYYKQDRLLKHEQLLKEHKETILWQFQEFITSYDYIPRYYEFAQYCHMNHKTFKEIYKSIDDVVKDLEFDVYTFYMNKVKKLLANGKIKTFRDFTWVKNKIPSKQWFIKNCPNQFVHDYNSFMEYCDFKPTYNISKELAIKIIYEMQSKLDRPLMYDDFRNPKQDEIGITTIKHHWGTMNKMKEELGLEIMQEDMVGKVKSIEEMKQDIVKLCNFIYQNEHRKTILYKDFNESDFCLGGQTYNKCLKDNNLNFRQFIESLGFKLQNPGSGLNYTYEDGEKTKSQFEYEFSNYLRSIINRKYNKNYFRDIRYKTFIKDYNGKMDCDYIIYHNDKAIYVEVAGILRDYKKWYYDDKIIESSKHKEKYRLKLQEKERMLKENNLEYYILFPSDLNKENLDGIFNV